MLCCVKNIEDVIDEGKFTNGTDFSLRKNMNEKYRCYLRDIFITNCAKSRANLSCALIGTFKLK